MELAVPILPVTDLAMARHFYVSQLGFDVEWEFAGEDGAGLLGVRRGTIQLTLDCPMSGHGRDAAVSLRVHSADAYHAEWSPKIPNVSPLRNEVWDARTFSVHDPFGNTLFVIGPR